MLTGPAFFGGSVDFLAFAFFNLPLPKFAISSNNPPPCGYYTLFYRDYIYYKISSGPEIL